jgi:hypothetical protein
MGCSFDAIVTARCHGGPGFARDAATGGSFQPVRHPDQRQRMLLCRMGDGDPDYVSSDCPIAGRRILQGIEERSGSPSRARKEHPLTLLRIAYGLE